MFNFNYSNFVNFYNPYQIAYTSCSLISLLIFYNIKIQLKYIFVNKLLFILSK